MNQSPYAPPLSDVVGKPETPNSASVSLPDMSTLDNNELRELLANPDVYTAESVHMAARELSARHAVPRYYTRMRSRHHSAAITVGRTWNMDLITKIHVLFSEKLLKRLCLAIAILDFILVAFRIVSFAKWLKLATPDIYAKSIQYMITTSLGMVYSMCVAIFFLTLYKTLSNRSIENS